MSLHPGQRLYDQALASLFNGDAAATDPLAIVQPRHEEDVVAAVHQARRDGLALMVRSGGHSRFCAADGALVLDLSAHFTAIELDGDRVRVQGGVGMGTHAKPGFGLLLMGGIGHLSRSLGLTLDHIVALRGVRADGTPFVLDEHGQDAKAWVWLRGAAPFLGVVTEATLRTHERRPLEVSRSLHALDGLPGHLLGAEALPRSRSCSYVLGVPPDRDQPALLRYSVAVAGSSGACSSAVDSAQVWCEQVMGLEDLPDFNMPCNDGRLPEEPMVDPDRRRRLRSWIHAISVEAGQSEALATILRTAIQGAPNRLCRIDLQQLGGAVSDQPITSSSYRGRKAAWSVVISGLWHADQSATADAVKQWSDDLFDALVPISCHVYLAERHPGTNRYGRQLQLAYGDDLVHLQALKSEWDPDQILPTLDASTPAEMSH